MTLDSPERELAEVVRLLVDEPDAVDIEAIEEEEAIVFELEVAPEDLGRVIGRQGRTVRALRNILDVRGQRDGERYDLEILE